MEQVINETDFAILEHEGGQHDTIQEKCPSCLKEKRMIKAWRTVNLESKTELALRGGLFGRETPWDNGRE